MEILWYKDRHKLIKIFEDWCKKENVDPKDSTNLVTWLHMNYLLNDKAVKDILNKSVYTDAEKHFIKLGIPKAALYSQTLDDGNCNQLVYRKIYSYYGAKEEWDLDYDCSISTGWDSETLLDVLIAIETNSKKKIIKFGLCERDYSDECKKIHFGKITDRVHLSECGDTFDLQLEDGRYFHLYFCESK